MRGVKTSISVSRCRENPDSSAIFAPKFAAAKRALGGVDPCPEKGGRGGLGVNPDHPQPRNRAQVADEERWKHKRRLRGEIFPPPISSSFSPHPPLTS